MVAKPYESEDYPHHRSKSRHSFQTARLGGGFAGYKRSNFNPNRFAPVRNSVSPRERFERITAEMQAIENLFRNGSLAFVVLEHARNKKQRLPRIIPSEAASMVARWRSFEAQVREIDERLGALNVFAALNAIDYETRHSNFLAWLFSPMESHGLGDAFLKEFFALVINKGRAGGIPNAQSWAAGTTVERERYGRIDLVILNHEKKFVCVVENKIHTGEHTNQLKRYREAIERDFPDYVRLFVFLTLRPKQPSDSHYVSLTYSELSDSLKRATPKSNISRASLPFLLHQYEEFLSESPKRKPNTFTALQLREIKHSDFHAWLFNPRGAHTLGLRAFTEFLLVVAATNPTFSVPALTDSELSDVEIRGRKRHRSSDRQRTR